MLAGAVTLAGGLAGAAHASNAGSLEAEFDTAFIKQSVAPTRLPPATLPVVRRGTPANIPLLALTPVRPSYTASSFAAPNYAPPVYATPLEASIASLADGSQGRIGVAAIDLASGRTVAVLGDQAFPMASTSKIAIVATYLAGVDTGRYTLADQYPMMMPVASKKFSSLTAPVRAGQMRSALDLIELTITRSDNHATDALLAAVGGPQVVTRWVQSNTGITEFRLDRTIATLVRDDGAINPAVNIDKRDSVTPLAMVRLLSGIYRGQWLSPASSEVLMGAMSRTVTGKTRIRGLLPEGTQVAHKTGTLANTASDVGFIRTPDGRELAVAIYVTGQGGKAERNARIASLARAIYDGYLAEASSQRRAAPR